MSVALPVVDTKPQPGAGIDYELFLDCVHCGLCTSSCPTYVELGDENDSPRGRIYLMRAVTDGRIDLNAEVRRHLDLCLDCRACESACPSGVQYGKLIEPFRVHMAKTQPDAPPLPLLQRLLLFHVAPSARRTRWALAPARLMQWSRLDRLAEKAGLFRLLPRSLRQLQNMLPRLERGPGRLPELLPAEGKRRARVALFTGCAGDAFFPQTTWNTARVLQRNGCEVVVPRGQVCCGALHYHAALEEPARELAAANVTAFGQSSPSASSFPGSAWELTAGEALPPGQAVPSAGARGGASRAVRSQAEPGNEAKGSYSDVDAILVNAAGCGAMLKDYGHLLPDEEGRNFAGKVRDISEFLVELGPVKPTHPLPLKAVYHDACHLCHAQQIRKQPRQLLEMIPGLELVPLAETEICCGAAGSYTVTQPEMAERLGRRKAKNILDTGAQAVFAGNVGCLLQIGRYLRQHTPPVRVAHPIDALWASYSGEGW